MQHLLFVLHRSRYKANLIFPIVIIVHEKRKKGQIVIPARDTAGSGGHVLMNGTIQIWLKSPGGRIPHNGMVRRRNFVTV
jgi:hypothetical protein